MTSHRTLRTGALVAGLNAAVVLPLYALPVQAATAGAWLLHVVALATALVLMLRAARSGDPVLRPARHWMAAALGTAVVGGIVAVGHIVVLGAVPVPSLVDPITLLYVPLAVYGFWRVPQREQSKVRRTRLSADSAVAATALLFISWLVVIEPLLQSGRWSTIGLLSQLAYPIGDVALAAMVLSLLPRVRADLRRMFNVVAVAMLLIAVSDSGFVLMLAQHAEPRFGWPDVTLQAGMGLLAYAACVRPDPVITSGSESRLDSLTYLPVAAAGVIGVLVVADRGMLDLDECAFGALMLTAVLVRQFLYAHDMTGVSEENRHASQHDELTGLANRKRFFGHLEEHLQTPGTDSALVLLFDLDGFKEVNDSLGHEAGDRVLRDFAGALRSAAPDALAARLGGDEFALLLSSPDRTALERDALAVATTLAVGTWGTTSLPVQVTCSVGLAHALPGDQPVDPVHRADLAMYKAKQSPGQRVALFSDGLARQAERRKLLTADLPRAVDRGEMHLVYQPLYRLVDGTLAGAEALLRWDHPLFGSVPPNEFIPLAEDSGAISSIGAWVLEQGLGQVAAWQRDGRYLPRLFVNVSAAQFDDDLPAQVVAVLDRHGLPAGRLTMEITETQLPGLAVSSAMQALREHGVHIALDDFGAGYSSLAQLARLPVDVLKIDRDFIRNLGESAGRPVLDAVINLAKALGLSTVAEGIEDLGQAAEASNAGVDYGQGYLFSRPELPAALALRLPLLPALPLQRQLPVTRTGEVAAARLPGSHDASRPASTESTSSTTS